LIIFTGNNFGLMPPRAKTTQAKKINVPIPKPGAKSIDP
jgi:hypothetical protein